MSKVKYTNYKNGKKEECEVKSKYSTGDFEQQYMIVLENGRELRVNQDRYEKYDVPETGNGHQQYLEKLEKLRKSGKCKLPANWKTMTVEQQCAYLDELLGIILDIDSDYEINVTLQQHKTYTTAFVQFTDEDCSCNYESDYVRCHLVRREQNVSFDELPKAFRDWAIDQFGKEEAENATMSVELVAGGKTFTQAMENLFDKIILLFYGYECLYYKDAYGDFCRENEEDDDDSEDWDDDLNLDIEDEMPEGDE